MSSKSFFVIVAIFLLIFLPMAADATHTGSFHLVPECLAIRQGEGGVVADEQLVPGYCTICDLFILIQNILWFLWTLIAMPLAALMLAYGGFMMLVPGVSGEKGAASYSKGKKIIFNTLIGLVVIFLAWLAIDTIMKTVSYNSAAFGPWNSINCVSAPMTIGGTPSGGTPTGGTPTGGTPITGQTCSGCVRTGNYLIGPNTCANQAQGQICQVNSALNDKLSAMQNAIFAEKGSGYWRVTEAWPPTRIHQNTCHQAATCVDANFIGGAKPSSDINYFVQKADGQGLRAVYEVATQVRADQLIAAGVPQENVLYVTGCANPPCITGEHFSVYLNPN